MGLTDHTRTMAALRVAGKARCLLWSGSTVPRLIWYLTLRDWNEKSVESPV